MAQLGGFFAVIYVAERALQQASVTAWRAFWPQTRGPMSYKTATQFGQLGASGGISLDPPSLSLINHTNRARVFLPVYARFSVQIDGATVGDVFIEARITTDVPIVVEQRETFRNVTIDLSGFAIPSADLRLTWVDGPDDTRASDAILSAESRAQLSDEIRRRAKNFLVLSLPTTEIWQAEFSGLTRGDGLVVLPLTKFGGVKAVDGWLALGVDDTIKQTTDGNPALIGPPPPPRVQVPHTAILVIDGALLQTFLAVNAHLALLEAMGRNPKLRPEGAPQVIIGDGVIEVISTGLFDTPPPFFAVRYTASIKIKFLLSPDSTVYVSVSPNIRVDTTLFEDIVIELANFFGADVFEKLRRANLNSLAALFKGKISVSVEALGASIHPEQIVIRPDATAIFGEVEMVGRNGVARENEMSFAPIQSIFGSGAVFSVHFRHHRIMGVRCHEPLFLQDPTYLLRYQLRRASDDNIVKVGRGWSGPQPDEIPGRWDQWNPLLYLESEQRVTVTAERPPGRLVGRGQFVIKMNDVFDRSHPFGRWRRRIIFADPPHVLQAKFRLSAIHKTKVTERCSYCDAGAWLPNCRGLYEIEGIDTLPAPSDRGFSDRLCPYCFTEQERRDIEG